MRQPRRQLPRLSDDRTISPTQTLLALKLVTAMDLLRLKAIARLHARGLPADVAWDDLLQESITRVLTGKRAKPDDVPMVAFLAGVMRSLRTDYLRRGSRYVNPDDPEFGKFALVDPLADPERALIATQELQKIRDLFADDLIALKVIAGLSEGLGPEPICAALGISRTVYNSARKRMRRCLLREGLTCGTI